MKFSVDDHPFIPPRELQRALAPLMPDMPVDFNYLLPSLSQLMMMMPEDEHSLVIGRSDHEMVYSAMADVGKAFIKLSDSYNYVKKTYVENYNLSKKLDSTSDDLETARFHLSEETKEVRKLKLQLKELKQAHATELEAKVAAAVEAFKSSAEYEKSLMDARDEGIEHCRYHIQSLRPQWDLSFLDHPPNPS
ncbi:hypothetical protein TIFTF001_030096 [Ficus carica]|uniref:Uncharacterized protein n=1 Tax=Ficus carica TaxID=3494 RepID=A0AA88DT63_FICCA|nr:hypothetical protein TIFTF001_030096 [Ficus carica]